MSRGFRTCMAKGGRGCLRPSYGRPKLTLVLRFVTTKFFPECVRSSWILTGPNFRVPSQKNVAGSYAFNFDAKTSNIASLNCYTPKFPGVGLKLT